MTETTTMVTEILKRHWFWPLALAVVAINASMIAIDGWALPQIKEFGVLFDFAVLIPLLYLICYRALGKKTLIRAVAFVCLGVWVAGHIVPEIHHSLITQISWIRHVGLAVLVAIEIRLAVEIWRIAFRSQDEETSANIRNKAESGGAPPWVAKLLAAEAKFWKRLWDFACKLIGRSG